MKRLLKVILVIFIIAIGLGYSFMKVINSTTFQFFGEIVNKVDTKEKVVALTFDDGPTNKTDEILKILHSKDVKATFFLTGSEIEKNPSEAQKIVEAGHEIGNHTYSHQRMIFKSPSFVKEEIEKTDQLIREAGYDGDIHFRPPYGKKLISLPQYLSEHNRKSILWNIEPETYGEIGSDSKKIIDHIGSKIEPGSIILLHVMYESRKESLESVEGIINELTEQGYEFKTVSELLE